MMVFATDAPDKAVCYFFNDTVTTEIFALSLHDALPIFESPATEFVDTRVEAWQKFPKPDWFVESQEQQWDQLIGIDRKSTPVNASHIDNVYGSQAMKIFAVPQAGFFQDYNSISGTNGAP